MADDVTVAMLVCGNLTSSVENASVGCGDGSLMGDEGDDAGDHRLLLLMTVTLYAVICVVGSVGNTVVFFVISLSNVMRSSVTNIYIANLALSDFCFLAGLPLLIITVLREVRRHHYVIICPIAIAQHGQIRSSLASVQLFYTVVPGPSSKIEFVLGQKR